MQKLVLDFVRKPSPTRVAIVFLLSGVMLSLFSAVQYWNAHQQAMKLSQELAQLQAQHPVVTSSVKKSPTRQQDLDQQRLQAISATLASPWSPLFAALESTASDDVALLSIQPDANKHQLRITAEARDYDTVLGYLQQLEQLPQLQDIHLMQHEIKVDERQQPVRFTVGANWNWPA